MNKETFIVMDCLELDQLIRLHFPDVPDYETMANEEIGSSQWNAYAKYNVSPFHTEEFEEMYSLGERLDELCYRGVIEAGNYMIGVNW